jgi:argininosuccinate lyase
VAAIWSSSDTQVGAAAVLAGKHLLPHADADAVMLCRDKLACRSALAKAGLPTPAFASISNSEEAARFVDVAPVILKPRSSTGSIGVKLCANRLDAAQHARSLLGEDGNSGVIAEEYIEGPEFSVEIFDGRALGVTRKRLSAPPNFIEIGHEFPADIDAAAERELRNVAEFAIAAVNLSRGPAHVELRLRGGRAFIVEINPRAAGGSIPELVQLATGFDLIEASLEFARGKPYSPGQPSCAASAVRFLLRPSHRSVAAVTGVDTALGRRDVVKVGTYPGAIGRSGPVRDFRDRVAYVVASGKTAEDATSAAYDGLACLTVQLMPEADIEKTGLLGSAVVEEARAIVFGQIGNAEDIECLRLTSMIDTAHALMLAHCGIVPKRTVGRVLEAIESLDAAKFAPLLGKPVPRGLYLQYEHELVAMAGQDAADAHIARSRNDINATIFCMRVRQEIADLALMLCRLRGSLLRSADRHAHVRMPMFSHRRPGMPSTWAHYLTGVERAVARDTQDLFSCLDILRCCPMGAGAGAGTSLAIDTGFTARLLGFDRGPVHSLDAVASRDAGARGLMAAGLAASTVSRLAADLLDWAGNLEAVELPDDLVGSSSIMPQKRNPFLLEHVIGKAGLVIGEIAGCLAAMHSASFANSIAVGTEGTRPVLSGIATAREVAILLSLVVDGARPVEARFAQLSRRGGTASTALALRLREKQKLSFRNAHNIVGQALRGLAPAVDTQAVANDLGLTGFPTDDAAVLVDELAFGGGPAETATKRYRDSAFADLSGDERRLAVYVERWTRADAELRTEREAFLKTKARETDK